MNKYNRTKDQTSNYIEEIKVISKGFVLTPLSCASIINEIIKLLLYQKSQIPYPYNWLKSVSTRKRKDSSVGEPKLENLKIEQHYKVVSSAFESLEDLILNLNSEFKNFGDNIKQVLILFGATVYCPKEAYRICISDFPKGHLEDNHLLTNSKKQHKILGDIVLAEQWLAAMETPIPPTNMFILIQKKGYFQNSDNFFQLNEQYSDHLRIKNTVINLQHDPNSTNNCCDGLRVFNDDEEDLIVDSVCSKADCASIHIDQDPLLLWYQAKVVIRGFKECYVNKVSAAELW